MNKGILKILIATLIFLIGIGAANALDDNSTDEIISFEQNDEIAVTDNCSEVLSVEESNDEIIAVSDNGSDVLSVEDSVDDVSAVSDGGSDVLSVEDSDEEISASYEGSDVLSVGDNNDEVIAVSDSDNEVLSVNIEEDETLSVSWGYSPADEYTQSQTEYKTFCIGKIKMPKKYKKFFLKDYKPSKKNKKAWKKYKRYKKVLKKQIKKLKKYYKNISYTLAENHWNDRGYDVWYKIKKTSTKYVVYYYLDCYRTYNYNPLLNKAWWD